MSITLYFGTKRKADLDNFNKLSLDALTGVAYEDDSQMKRATVAMAYDKQKPRKNFWLSHILTRDASNRNEGTAVPSERMRSALVICLRPAKKGE